jgi:hypothetical protein
MIRRSANSAFTELGTQTERLRTITADTQAVVQCGDFGSSYTCRHGPYQTAFACLKPVVR